jgi:hypothetical protein
MLAAVLTPSNTARHASALRACPSQLLGQSTSWTSRGPLTGSPKDRDPVARLGEIAAPTLVAVGRHIEIGPQCARMLVRSVSGDDAEREALERTIVLRHPGTTEEVAAMMPFPASGEAAYCTGGVFMVDGGMPAI